MNDIWCLYVYVYEIIREIYIYKFNDELNYILLVDVLK